MLALKIEDGSRPTSIDHFALQLATIPSSLPCSKVYDRFAADGDLIALPVVDSGRPVGLVARWEFEHSLAHGFGRALYERKPVSVLMDSQPLIIDRSTPVETIQNVIATDRPSALLRGFIVTDADRYVGVVTALGLLKASLANTERRNAELLRAYNAAEASNRAKSAFLASMSHELRTPLNAIIGFAESLASGLVGPMAPRQEEYLGYIRDSGAHLLRVINEILDLSKVDAERLDLREELIDPGYMLEGAMRMIQTQAKSGGVALRLTIPEALPRLRADAGRARQILLNLLSNAVKFTPASGEVHAAVCEQNGAIRFVIADTGIGIAPEHMAKAFEIFGQIDSSLARRYNGAGLGLPLAKRLAELHGATLTLESTVGEGTTATVIFPPERAISEDEESIALASAGGGK